MIAYIWLVTVSDPPARQSRGAGKLCTNLFPPPELLRRSDLMALQVRPESTQPVMCPGFQQSVLSMGASIQQIPSGPAGLPTATRGRMYGCNPFLWSQIATALGNRAASMYGHIGDTSFRAGHIGNTFRLLGEPQMISGVRLPESTGRRVDSTCTPANPCLERLFMSISCVALSASIRY